MPPREKAGPSFLRGFSRPPPAAVGSVAHFAPRLEGREISLGVLSPFGRRAIIPADMAESAGEKYQLPDLREKATNPKGEAQVSEKRLYLQLQVYTGCDRAESLVEELKASGLESVLYLDVNDPKGVGVLAMSEDPEIGRAHV